jgi:phosphoadenosine phosphosulfate reductase
MQKIGLAFSGGKDSWACLWLNKDRLDDIEVIWVNTGKNYPELLATIDHAKKLCPHFTEINSDRETQNRIYGIPSALVPVDWTVEGQLFSGQKQVTVQPYLNCCYQNIGAKITEYCKAHGITHIIRGQRNDEIHKSAISDGTEIDGITYIQPLDNWTADDVLSFVEKNMPLPDHFRFSHSSMDCYDCTAYLDESQDRIGYMRNYHPSLYEEFQQRRELLISVIMQSAKGI